MDQADRKTRLTRSRHRRLHQWGRGHQRRHIKTVKMTCEDWCQEDLGDYPMPPPPPPPDLEDDDLLVLVRGCQCGEEEEDRGPMTRSIYIVIIISILSVILLLIICIFIVCCVNNRWVQYLFAQLWASLIVWVAGKENNQDLFWLTPRLSSHAWPRPSSIITSESSGSWEKNILGGGARLIQANVIMSMSRWVRSAPQRITITSLLRGDDLFIVFRSECDNKWSIFVGLWAKHVSSSNELILARSGDSENNKSWRNITAFPCVPCLHNNKLGPTSHIRVIMRWSLLIMTSDDPGTTQVWHWSAASSCLA